MRSWLLKVGHGPQKGYWVSSVAPDWPEEENPWPKGKMQQWLTQVPGLEIVPGYKGKPTVQFQDAGFAAYLADDDVEEGVNPPEKKGFAATYFGDAPKIPRVEDRHGLSRKQWDKARRAKAQGPSPEGRGQPQGRKKPDRGG